jgi:hypothetical protein
MVYSFPARFIMSLKRCVCFLFISEIFTPEQFPGQLESVDWQNPVIEGRQIQTLSRLVTLWLSDGCDRWFTVRFPCQTLVDPHSTATGANQQQQQQEYTWIEQLHAVHDCPIRWRYPLRLLLQRLQLTLPAELVTSSPSDTTVTALPSTQRHITLSDPHNARFGASTLPTSTSIRLMAIPLEAIYRVTSSGADVEVYWLQDQSSFFTTNRFRHVSLNTAAAARRGTAADANNKQTVVMFKMELAPVELFNPHLKFYYPLARILQTASSILSNNHVNSTETCNNNHNDYDNNNDDTCVYHLTGKENEPLTNSELLIESVAVPGQGEFRLYGNGRVRAAFDDFTILDLTPTPSGGNQLMIILRNGDKLTFPDAALAWEDRLLKPYLVQAMRFRSWAAADSRERLDLERRWLQDASFVRSALLRSQRFINPIDGFIDEGGVIALNDPLSVIERIKQRNERYLSMK